MNLTLKDWGSSPMGAWEATSGRGVAEVKAWDRDGDRWERRPGPCRLKGLGSEQRGQGRVPGGLGRGFRKSSQEAGGSGLIENTLWRPAHKDCYVGACSPLCHPFGASSQAPIPVPGLWGVTQSLSLSSRRDGLHQGNASLILKWGHCPGPGWRVGSPPLPPPVSQTSCPFSGCFGDMDSHGLQEGSFPPRPGERRTPLSTRGLLKPPPRWRASEPRQQLFLPITPKYTFGGAADPTKAVAGSKLEGQHPALTREEAGLGVPRDLVTS